jgi:hypothetical protein
VRGRRLGNNLSMPDGDRLGILAEPACGLSRDANALS